MALKDRNATRLFKLCRREGGRRAQPSPPRCAALRLRDGIPSAAALSHGCRRAGAAADGRVAQAARAQGREGGRYQRQGCQGTAHRRTPWRAPMPAAITVATLSHLRPVVLRIGLSRCREQRAV
jgi:hypothetical protein